MGRAVKRPGAAGSFHPVSNGPGHDDSPPSSKAASRPRTRSIHTSRPATMPPASS